MGLPMGKRDDKYRLKGMSAIDAGFFKVAGYKAEKSG
jgi:hypothetical protein